MKKSLLCGILVCLSMVAYAQRSMEWYSYWGSNESGSQIDPQRMAVDKSGNIYVAALFGGTSVAVESETLNSNSGTDKGDAVIVKLSPAKTIQWTYTLVDKGNATITDLAVDKKGNVVAVGVFDKSIKVGDESMAVDDSNDGEKAIYILKLNANGAVVKAQQIAVGMDATKVSLALDSKNNIIIAALVDGDVTLEEGGEAEGDFNGHNQILLVKYDKDGALLWHQFLYNKGNYGKPYLAVDASDNIYVAGSFTGNVKFKGEDMAASVSNAFLFAYDAEGAERWYHVIEGDESDVAAAVAVSPIGEVALAVNHHSGDLRLDDMSDVFNNGYAFDPAYAHTAIFSFTLSGDFKWFYNWGYSNGTDGSDAICYALRCTDEGVWYAAGMMTGRYGGSRLPEEIRTLANGKNSGVETVDNQWMQHNTNGGHDCYLITLTRKGQLANVIRPGGPQYEDGIDVALSPDKKSLYFLMQNNVRDKEPSTCPDNIFDSWTDITAYSRKSKYTAINVYCPENGKENPYTTKYKGLFASSMLVKYAMPEIKPTKLPYFIVGEPYEATISLANPKGKVSMFQLGQSGDVNFDGTNISGTFDTDADRYAGVLAIDSIALPGEIKYYEYDATLKRSIRSNPRSCRYLAITIEKPDEPEDPEDAVENVMSAGKNEGVRKFMRDGILYIERNGILYNAQGAALK